MEQIEIYIHEIINDDFCVSTKDAELIFEIIKENFVKKNKVILNFREIKLIIASFLSVSIGQLYGKYGYKFIKNHLSAKNMLNDDKFLLNRVIDNAKQYYKNEYQFKEIE